MAHKPYAIFDNVHLYSVGHFADSQANAARTRSPAREALNLGSIAALVAFPTIVTMVVSGLWHGAAWTFIVWGLLHGLYLTINQSWRMLSERLWRNQFCYDRLMKHLWLVLTLLSVLIAEVFFRAASVQSAFRIIRGLIGVNGISPIDIQVLNAAGVSVPPISIAEFIPLVPFLWLATLFVIVLTMPNSLELLRGFGPALEFPIREPAKASQLRLGAGHRLLERAPSVVVRILEAAMSVFQSIHRNDILLGGLSATAIALRGVLRLMALSKSGGFVYGGF